MGARLSTIPENRGPLVTATAGPGSYPSGYNKPAATRDRYNWSNRFPVENKAPAAPVCAAFPFPPANSNPSNNYPAATTTNKPSSVAAACGGDVAGGGRGGSGVTFPVNVKPTNTKEVIVFHSSTKWKEYFEASKQSNKLVVIYFTATWCGPCRYMEPSIKEIAAKHTDIDLVKIDVDELFNVSREYGVQAMPTFLFMKKGKQIDKVVGARKEELQRKVEKHRA